MEEATIQPYMSPLKTLANASRLSQAEEHWVARENSICEAYVTLKLQAIVGTWGIKEVGSLVYTPLQTPTTFLHSVLKPYCSQAE